MTYFDTGYLVKCYLPERGFERVRDLATTRGRIACSTFGRAELHAALHRKLREGLLTEKALETVLRQLDLDETHNLWSWLPLTDAQLTSLCAVFRALPPSVYLRTGDAIHLVTARDHGFAEIFSSDIRLIAAAPHFGLDARDVTASSS